jgi:integrase
MSSLYRRPKKSGIYWLSFRHDGRAYCRSLKTRDRSTAIYLKAQKDQELIEGKNIIPDKRILCLSILEKYRSDHKHLRTSKTNDNQCQKVRAFLDWAEISSFGQITQDKLKTYLTHRIEADHISLHTANTTIQNLKTWISWCVKNRYAIENPIAGLPKYRIPQKEVRFLSEAELKALLNAARDPVLYCDGEATLYPLIATGIYTGMRQQELFNLTWEDIDWTHRQITVQNKEGFTTKNKKNRTIPLHDHLRKILKPLAKKSGPCFDTTNARRIFGRIRKAAKVPGIGWHTLRHTCASHLAAQGVDVATIAKILGHASITTTQIYMHLSPDHLKDSISRLPY